MQLDCSRARLHCDLIIVKTIFFICALFWFSGLAYSFAQSKDAIDAMQSSDIAHLQSDIEKANADIKTLTSAINNLAASTNEFIGIGKAIGGLGTIIVILQGVQVVRTKKVGG